jgi:hypothetical protein
MLQQGECQLYCPFTKALSPAPVRYTVREIYKGREGQEKPSLLGDR